MSRRPLRLSALTVLFCLIPIIALASSMSPELYGQLKQEGRLDTVVNRLEDARNRGYFHIPRPSSAKPLYEPSAGDVDTIRVPVILVDFSDHVYTNYGGAPEASDFDSTLFSWGEMPTGSMSEWYWENSYETFFVHGDVVGWYRMPHTYAYYVNAQNGFGSCPNCAREMVKDAVYAAEFDLDYSDYDRNNDGWVDGIFVVFAGYGAEQTGNDNDIWSHRSSINPITLNGVKVSDYSVEPEARTDGHITDIGVFCHEFGHVLGLPDLYDTDYSSSGIGRWSMMAGGSWNGSGDTPAHFDAWCKKELGFTNPVVITANEAGSLIPQAESEPVAYRLWTQGLGGSQYFLVENRQLTLFDAALPGEGLLIWHIDETRSGNSDETHPLVGLEQADGLFQLEAGAGSNGGDPWPGNTDHREFSDFSTPNAHNYNGDLTEVGVLEISDSDSLMTADLEIVYGRPWLFADGSSFNDPLGDNNGRADPGESDVEFIYSITNLGADALGLTLGVTCTDPELVFSSSTSSYGDVLNKQPGDNSADPIIFSIDADFPPTVVEFEMTWSANAGEYALVETLKVNIGPPQFLVVDDDQGNQNEYEHYFTYLLDSLRAPHIIWGKDTLSTPPADTLTEYPVTIWFTGDARSEVLSAADVANLKSYLDGGGRLLLTGQDIAQDLADDADSTFLRDYLHVRYIPGDPIIAADGVPGDPIGNGQFVSLGGPGGASNQNSPDIIEPVDGAAEVCYTYYNSSDAAGVRVADGNYKAVFLPWGMEAIANDLGYTTREEVLERVFQWLGWLSGNYVPGDINSDLSINPVDVVLIVNFVYKGGAEPLVMNSADVNGDCAANPVDVVFMVNYVYKSIGTLLPGCID